MVYHKHQRVAMVDALYLTKYNHLLNSMVLLIIKQHRYGPKQVGKMSELIALLRKLYNLLLTKDVIGNMIWIYFGSAAETFFIVQVKDWLSCLVFSRVVRDKLSTVLSTVDSTRYDDKVKRNRAQREKIANYVAVKRKAKPTELNAGDDVLVKHNSYERQIDKLLSKWFVYCNQDDPVCNYC